MNIANVALREVLLFDLDGTLVDSATDLHRAMNMSLNALQLPTAVSYTHLTLPTSDLV